MSDQGGNLPHVDTEALWASIEDASYEDTCPLCDDGTEEPVRVVPLVALRRILDTAPAQPVEEVSGDE